jgi:hypothetical protein
MPDGRPQARSASRRYRWQFPGFDAGVEVGRILKIRVRYAELVMIEVAYCEKLQMLQYKLFGFW